MGLFDFLGNIGHDIGSGASSVGSGVFNFLKPAVNTAESLGHQAYQVGAILPNDIRSAVGFATGNQAAGRSAFNQAGAGVSDVVNLARAIPRGIVQLGESVPTRGANTRQQEQVTPAGKFVFGNEPIPSLQKEFIQTNQQTGSPAQAVGQTTMSFLGDILGAKGGAETLGKGIDVAANLSDSAKAAGDVQASKVSGLKPENVVNSNEVGTLKDFAQYKMGDYKPSNADINQLQLRARNAADTAGIDISTGSPRDIAGRIEQYVSQYDQHIQARNNVLQGGYIQLPGEAAATNADIQAPGPDINKGIDQLAKANTVEDVKKIMDGTPQPIVDKVAPAIALAKDPNVVRNILDNVTKPPEPAAPPTVTPPAPQLAPDGLPARGFAKSVQESPNFSPALKQTATEAPGYKPATDVNALDTSQKLLNSKGLNDAHTEVLGRLQSGETGKQIITDAGNVMQHLSQAGRDAEAANLFNHLSEAGTTGGQTVQAFGLLQKMTPEGIVYTAQKTLDRAKVPITDDIATKLQGFKDQIKQTAQGTPEREKAVTDLQQFVKKEIPSSATDKVFAVWRAGLLTGPQTVAKILTSHTVNSALEAAKDIPASAVDRFVSLFTGQRSLVLTGKGLAEGAKQGVEAGKTLLAKGVDVNPGTNASELYQTVNFGKSVPSKIAQAYVDTIGHIHGSLYKPFYGAAHLQSLYSQGLAAAKTAGLKGAEASDYVQNFVTNPSADALQIAKNDAEHATFQQETALGNVASAIQKKGGIIGKVIAPFTRIPSAIATDLINYSPVGLAKTLVDGIKTAKSEEGWTIQAQREFSQGIGRGLVGSAAIVPGIMLFNRKIMTLEYPTDPKEQKLWALEGKQPNSILIGGQWRSLGSIGPAGSVLEIGGHIADSLAKGNDLGTSLINGFSGGLRSIESQSYLQGVSGAINAVNDPGRYAANFAKQTAGSVVPTGISTVANATDQYQRQLNSPLDAVKGRIPGLRESLPPKIDTFGNPIRQGETGIEKLIDPFQSSTSRLPQPLIEQLQHLQDAGLGILPATISKTPTFNGIKTALTPDQIRQLTTATGQATLAKWTALMTRPGWDNLSDPQKSAALTSAYNRIASIQKNKFARGQNVGQFSLNYRADKKATKANKTYVANKKG